MPSISCKEHYFYMRRCLELAQRGRGKIGINPMVGAVLAREGEIVAEEFHEGFGKPHAERNLLEKIEQIICSKDTLYVNLEPCVHSDKKTPPCAQFLVEEGIKRVVFGMFDPNPKVAGKGIEFLKKNGVEVIGPVMPAECARFNRGFVSLMTKGRPWITLKSAQTKDGRVANEAGPRLMITNQEQDRWSHEFLRARHDAILVGIGTILKDDPELTVRFPRPPHPNPSPEGRGAFQPWRIVLDAEGILPKNAKIRGDRLIHITKNEVPLKDGCFDWLALWKKLTTPVGDFHGITSMLVEGGPKTWQIFREANLVDEELTLVGRASTSAY